MIFNIVNFQDDVDSYMQKDGNTTAEAVLGQLDEQYQKYKFMEVNLIQKRARFVVYWFQFHSWSSIFNSQLLEDLQPLSVSYVFQICGYGKKQVGIRSKYLARTGPEMSKAAIARSIGELASSLDTCDRSAEVTRSPWSLK